MSWFTIVKGKVTMGMVGPAIRDILDEWMPTAEIGRSYFLREIRGAMKEPFSKFLIEELGVPKATAKRFTSQMHTDEKWKWDGILVGYLRKNLFLMSHWGGWTRMG